MKSVAVAFTALSVFAESERVGANPIRKVVNMLQAMQKKIEEEGEKEKELYEKFVCYCKSNTGELTKSIADAQAKIAQLETQVKEDSAAKAQTDEELVNHKQDRAEAKASLSAATKQREKDAKVYAKESGDTGTNIEALGKAITAIGTGLGGGAFIQTTEGSMLKQVLMTSRMSLSDVDRDSVYAFLSGSISAPGSSEIVGILKEMKDEMSRDLGGLVEAENKSKAAFEQLAAAKRKEIAAGTVAIEQKTQRSGELAVKIVQGKNDLEDTLSALGEDEQFQVNLRRDCKTKEADMNTRTKTRSDELQALAETIKVLNDDDALDLFKKTMPGGKSFIQKSSSSVVRARNIINEVAKTYRSTQLDFISLALKGKKVDFSKVVKMIDDMVATLKVEQTDDDNHKTYCEKEFDTSEDKQGDVERRIESLTHEKTEADTASKNLAAEIKTLQEGIAALDKSVAEASEQRKSEHAEYVQTSAENRAALDLIAFAKNRLNKFYNPKMYKAPPARELTEEQRVYQNFGGELQPTPAPGGIAGTGISAFVQLHNSAAPPPPPETFGAYSKKSAESGGVIAMMDMLANDLKKDVQAAEHEEKDSQEEYEELMTDSQKKRAADSKSITTKDQAKAESDSVAEGASENLGSSNKELTLTKEYIGNLHKSCDFLQENFDFRKAAREQEVDALKKSKAVLQGADYSLLQTDTFLAKETPCITMCRELNQYPKCNCPNFTYDATPNVVTFDELWQLFDRLIESGRQQLKEARANA